jgi:hypothetical protein
MEILSKLFGSETKVKVMRLFLLNPDKVFAVKEIVDRVKSSHSKVRSELSTLLKIDLIKKRSSQKNRGGYGFSVNPQFPYLATLQNFLVNTEPLQSKDLIKRFSKVGSIKLIVVSGVFMQEPESRIDMLIVGDNVKKGNLENTMKNLESEIGKELRYTHFTTEDFKYRLSMFDKLTRDILDYPHKKVLNKLGIV